MSIIQQQLSIHLTFIHRDFNHLEVSSGSNGQSNDYPILTNYSFGLISLQFLVKRGFIVVIHKVKIMSDFKIYNRN
jgi:hypothetical protein